MTSLMLVEDDARLSALTQRYLQGNGFNVMPEENGLLARERILASPPDIVLLDIGLPGLDGLDVCRSIRPHYTGILCIFSALADDIHQVLGLELGADDYITKPVEPRLLLARLRAHLRRMEPPALRAPLCIGALRIDLQARSVYLHEQPVVLTTAEYDLLALLACNSGRVMARDELFHSLRGIDFDGLDRSIDGRISRLRRKLGDSDEGTSIIRTVRGRGYLFVPPSGS